MMDAFEYKGSVYFKKEKKKEAFRILKTLLFSDILNPMPFINYQGSFLTTGRPTVNSTLTVLQQLIVFKLRKI